jgi:hypothetical protein
MIIEERDEGIKPDKPGHSPRPKGLTGRISSWNTWARSTAISPKRSVS